MSMMMTGFHRIDDEHHTPIQCLWSNFQDWGAGDAEEAWDEFHFTLFRVRAGEVWPTLVQRIGAYNALPPEQVEQEFRPLLAKGRPPVAIRNKTIRVLPTQSRIHRTIGVNANAAILFPNGAVEWSYWTGAPSWKVSLGNTVLATSEQVLLIADAEIEVAATEPGGRPQPPGAPMVVPQVPKNRPCPCGSGKRYRQCHGSQT